MVVTSAPTTSLAPYWVIASNAGPSRSMSSSMPSTISAMPDSTCAIRREENAGISSRRSRACRSPSIWVMNSMPMNLSYCS